MVWKLDRLGRSLKQLIDVVEGLKAKDINFRVLKDGISTDTIGGELTFHMFGTLAEFERKLIVLSLGVDWAADQKKWMQR